MSSVRKRVIAGAGAVAVLGVAVVGWQLTHKGPPSFRRGGQFAVAGPAPGDTTTSTAAGSPETTTVTAPPAAVPGTPGSTAVPDTTATTVRRPSGASSTTLTSRVAGATITTRAPSGPAPAATAPATPTTAAKPSGPGRPAAGTYTWTVDGTEGASFVGSRRFPEKMTMVVHGGAGLKPDQLVFDLNYSDKHAEREIVGFRSDGIYFDFEGGSVTFGPRTETSQADYDPPILQIPTPLQPGLSRSGVTRATGADGKVSRTEDWKTTVIGQESVTVAGATINAWKIEVQRKFRPGTADQGFRNKTMWFDPARSIWVKFTEVFHGERHTAGFSFTYDSDVTATLESFTP